MEEAARDDLISDALHRIVAPSIVHTLEIS